MDQTHTDIPSQYEGSKHRYTLSLSLSTYHSLSTGGWVPCLGCGEFGGTNGGHLGIQTVVQVAILVVLEGSDAQAEGG